jgi:hypothetical protein
MEFIIEMFSIFTNILKSKDVRIVFSIIWGLGLSSLFRRVCKGRNCIIYRAPSPEDIKGKTFGFNNKCYTYEPSMVNCEGNNIVPPEEFKCFN